MINHWHSILNMPKNDRAWHERDIADELAEYREAEGLIDKWSELSDVAYTYTRARWSGHALDWPLNRSKFLIGLWYMFPKYSLRWYFYRVVGKKIDKAVKMTEVRNPQKLDKLETIAKKYNLDPEQFVAEARRIMKWWVFLK